MKIEIKDFYGEKQTWDLSQYETSTNGLLKFIEDLMIKYGPDGHCDGANQIMIGMLEFIQYKFNNNVRL